LAVKIRHPWWATAKFEIRVNGRLQEALSTPGSYATIARTWSGGDRVEVAMPFALRTEGFRDNPQRFAFLNGPVVLAAQVQPGKPFPVIVCEAKDVASRLQPVEGKPSTFTGPASVFRVASEPKDVTLEPLYKIHGERHYAVYFDAFTPVQWQAREAEYHAQAEREKALAARTVDLVNPGEEQNERDHQLKSQRSNHGIHAGRKWRDARDGWFSWQMKCLPNVPQELRTTYWGSDAGRSFEILVDGKKIAAESLNNKHPNEFFDVTYRIPAELTKDKSAVTVRFEAQPGSTAGGVFECRVLQAE
jgi:hypothetical protein